VEALVSSDRATAVIGPLSGAAAEAAAKKAEELKIPIMVMSVKEDISAIGDFVFREFAGNKIEPFVLVAVAEARGASRFGVLFPDNGYGRAVRAMFAAAVKAKDLSLVTEVSYAPESVSFKEQAERLAQENIDALLIPDQASKIALIAPALAAAGMWSAPIGEPYLGTGKAVQLIIPSVGFSDDLIRRAGRYLEGALFSVFFAPEVIPASKDFATRYQLEYGTRPSIVSAYAHDAALIIGRAVEDDIKSRGDLRRWLIESASLAAASIPTAAPFSGFTANGAPKALPYILSLRNSKVTVVDTSDLPVGGDIIPSD
jgi:ABC-type branched-subunit amino acid transport system substrate-binding protein